MSKAPEGRTRNEKVFGSHSKKAVVEQNTKNKQTNKKKNGTLTSIIAQGSSEKGRKQQKKG